MECIGSKDSVTCWSIVYIHYLRSTLQTCDSSLQPPVQSKEPLSSL